MPVIRDVFVNPMAVLSQTGAVLSDAITASISGKTSISCVNVSRQYAPFSTLKQLSVSIMVTTWRRPVLFTKRRTTVLSTPRAPFTAVQVTLSSHTTFQPELSLLACHGVLFLTVTSSGEQPCARSIVKFGFR